MGDQPIWITFLVTFIIMVVLLLCMAYTTWYERKVLARFQDRLGPTRTGPAGLLQPLADAAKVMAKEDLVPDAADRKVFLLAPVVTFTTSLVSAAVIPWGGTVQIFGTNVNLYPTDTSARSSFWQAARSACTVLCWAVGHPVIAIRCSAVSAPRRR